MAVERMVYVPDSVRSTDARELFASAPPGERLGRVPHEVFNAIPKIPHDSTEVRVFNKEEQDRLRGNFGPGRAGNIAFNAFIHGEPCAADVPDIENGEGMRDCGNQSVATIGFDVPDDYDVLGACSQEHWYAIATLMDSRVQPGDHDHSFDINGWGRD